MTNVAVQPCGDSDATQHYVDTILNPVSLNTITEYLDSPKSLGIVNPKSEYAVWGVTAGDKNVNKNKWQKLNAGDVVLLYKKKKIFSQGYIKALIHSPELAFELWKTNKSGNTWEYLYLLDEIEEIEIPIEKYNNVLGYKETAIIQGFNVHTEEKAEKILDLLEIDNYLDYNIDSNQENNQEYFKEKLEQIHQTDSDQKTKSRNEQPILRKHLFGQSQFSKCHICGQEYPVAMLVAAHIKKRSSCTDEERKDLNIVMSACKFGCDELYERGHIQVGSNGLITSKNLIENDAVNNYIKKIEGKSCISYSTQNEIYFKWHRNQKKKFMK